MRPWVPEAKLTRERWILRPATFARVGEFVVHGCLRKKRAKSVMEMCSEIREEFLRLHEIRVGDVFHVFDDLTWRFYVLGFVEPFGGDDVGR